ncbi:MAG: RNA polymerase subunit sigma-70, partial [Alcaligenaceae bacterium]
MLTSPAAMAQRLVRAKQKIRDARLRFEEPALDELPQRLHAVLDAIYAAYGLGWDAGNGGEESRTCHSIGMRDEALFLGGLVCQLLPQEPEAWGLLALMHFCESRTAARGDAMGCFIPLLEQDTALWNRSAINFAEQCLRRAAQMGSL